MNFSTSTFRQSGWSLPISWLLLIVPIGAFYFFSWMGLVYLVGLIILISAITIIYDIFRPEPDSTSTAEVNYWFKSGYAIEQVAEVLTSEFKLQITSIEDKWALIENRRFTYNLSQTYGMDENQIAIYHLNIAAESYHLDEDEKPFLGKKLANALKTNIHRGHLDENTNNESGDPAYEVYKYKSES